jgi:3-phenylpropionate/trans-cinnamate dioxygenase ferredoxin reductase subunit
MTSTIVIVGAGLAGAGAAAKLRTEGFDGRIVLLGEERDRPYERPPMSKGYLRGEASFDEAAVHDAGFYDEQGIELRTGTRATKLDPASSAVELASGERLAYDHVLLATGAAPRRLALRGSDLDGVHYLRTRQDSDELHRAVTSGADVVVIGAGWIGTEVAASARQLGAGVTMVDVAPLPLERVLGPEIGTVYRDLHADHGVRLRLGAGIEAIEGDTVVTGVRLTDGSILPAGVVVVGVGVVPRTELADAAGIEVADGITTDEYLATGAPGIHAAGDVADAWHPHYGRRLRLEHWSAALHQGPVAALNMLGVPTPYARIPYFFSDQFDLGMEYRGWSVGYDQVVVRGDLTRREFVAFWLRQERVLAAMNANVWDQNDAIEGLVATGAAVDPTRLADPAVDLAVLAAH